MALLLWLRALGLGQRTCGHHVLQAADHLRALGPTFFNLCVLDEVILRLCLVATLDLLDQFVLYLIGA